MRLDLNRICIVGLVIMLLGAVLLVLQYALGQMLTVGGILGPDAPSAQTPLWMVFVTAGAVVYLVGRVVWLARNRFP